MILSTHYAGSTNYPGPTSDSWMIFEGEGTKHSAIALLSLGYCLYLEGE